MTKLVLKIFFLIFFNYLVIQGNENETNKLSSWKVAR